MTMRAIFQTDAIEKRLIANLQRKKNQSFAVRKAVMDEAATELLVRMLIEVPEDSGDLASTLFVQVSDDATELIAGSHGGLPYVLKQHYEELVHPKPTAKDHFITDPVNAIGKSLPRRLRAEAERRKML